MFGVVPKVLWSKTNPPDEHNRINMGLRSLLVQFANRKILIDTGMGNKWSDRMCSMYKLDTKTSNITSELKKLKLSKDDITDIIITHLHFDHTGGSTIKKNGELIPAFRNATYHVSRRNWEWANNPMEKDRASYLKDNFSPLQKFNVLNIVESLDELNIEGLTNYISDGHTFGMFLPIFSSEEESLIYGADLIPTSSHISIPYVMGYDLQPMKTIEEKKDVLSKIVETKQILFFEHDPEIVASTIRLNNKQKYVIDERINI